MAAIPARSSPTHQRKSIGHESTFAEDVHDRVAVERTLLELVEQVAQRLRRHGVLGQTVHLKLRTADFHTVTRQVQLPAPADTSEAIWPAARRLFAKADQTRQAIRLIGVSVSLSEGEQQLGTVPAARRPAPPRGARGGSVDGEVRAGV